MGRKRDAHHLWVAETDEDKLKLRRTNYLDDDDQETKMTAKRTASRKTAAKEASLACLGVWGATLVDDKVFVKQIPASIVARFNSVQDNDAPTTYTWAQLSASVGAEKVADVRKAISDGMRTRLVSKEMNVPFLVAAEIVDKLAGLDKSLVTDAVKAIKSGSKTAMRRYGGVAKTIYAAFEQYAGRKLAIDDKAARYFIDYFGPYGQELVAEIQRRVRADIAKTWLRKNGVDEAAAEYWSNYFSDQDYGAALVSVIPKKISPAK